MFLTIGTPDTHTRLVIISHQWVLASCRHQSQLGFYLFLSTIILILGGHRIHHEADAIFARACGNACFAGAVLCFGTAFYLQGAFILFDARDYGASRLSVHTFICNKYSY